MKRMRKRLLSMLLAMVFCLGLLPATAWAANFPGKFYAALMNVSGMGTVNSYLNYTSKNTEAQQVYGMEHAGGVFFTVVGKKEDDGWRELRMYNSNLTNSRTIGDVINQSGTVQYAIVDTAMNISGAEPVLYGTYNGYALVGDKPVYCSSICQISLTDGKTSNWQTVTDIPETDIIYAIAFDKEGTLYGIGADMGDDGGPASLYTIDLDTGAATLVGAIMTGSGSAVSTNYLQDLAFDHAQNTLYWAENAENDLYTLNTTDAVATKVGQVKSSGKVYPIQSFCIPYDTAFGQADDQYMISVICEGAGEVTCNDENKPFYLVNSGEDITLTIEFNTGGVDDNLLGVTVDGKTVSISSLVDNSYTFENVTGNHVIEVKLKKEIPATQKTVTWLHYQGEPASFYTVDNVYKFYDLPYLDKEVPREDYVQTLLDEEGKPIDDDEIILPGSYDVHVTHPGNADYAAMDVIYTDALVLGKCPGTPGRPVVYGKVGCTQGDLTTTSALQDYYGSDGELIDSAHDEIPVTLVWLSPETRYDTAGNFYASATIHAADNLDQRLKDCYALDNGDPLEDGCQISSRATQVVVLPADEASLIKVQASDASGGTVSGKGVYKNGDSVTVTATVNDSAGYTFGGWQEDGSVVSNDATYTFNASGDRTLTALFEVNENYRVILKTDPQDGGTVTGGGNYKEGNHEATVTAAPKPGYYFMGWYEGGTQKSTDTSYTFEVEESGAVLTAKFGVDYLARAEQAKENFKSALGKDIFEWATLEQAVDTYHAAADFVKNPPSVIQDAETRYAALTAYYQSVTALDLSNQGISSGDLAKLALFTGVIELNLSGNKGITELSGLTQAAALEALDISGTGVTTADVLVSGDALAFPRLKTLTAKNLSLTSISALAKAAGADGFNTDAITKWDFTGSTLTDTEDNKADVAAIQNVLNVEIQKFIPPTIQAPPTGGGGGGATTYAVTVEKAEHGKVTASPSRASSGTPVTITVTPDEGYELEKLTVTDSKGSEVKLTDKGNGKYTFDMPNTKVEIRAVFRKIAPVWENCPGGVDCPAYSYRDVNTSAWYHEAVDYVLVNGLMSGYGNGVFGPNDHLSRAQLCQILYNKEGRPAVTGSSVFTDVAGTAWYADAVIWANANGIVGGYGGGVFGPDDPITREQLAAILWRYAGSPESSHSLDAFTDAGQISDWAMDAMRWANENGVLNGDGSGHLIPRGNATRAHVAQMIQNFLENIGV